MAIADGTYITYRKPQPKKPAEPRSVSRLVSPSMRSSTDFHNGTRKPQASESYSTSSAVKKTAPAPLSAASVPPASAPTQPPTVFSGEPGSAASCSKASASARAALSASCTAVSLVASPRASVVRLDRKARSEVTSRRRSGMASAVEELNRAAESRGAMEEERVSRIPEGVKGASTADRAEAIRLAPLQQPLSVAPSSRQAAPWAVGRSSCSTSAMVIWLGMTPPHSSVLLKVSTKLVGTVSANAMLSNRIAPTT
mmetsp:Transcript_30361/g.96908  ORF Transcript_30361/g.96908 Transcript_30361/m.96908 type:complete len:255 (-) Transcript_30361:1140-1904(-)